VDHSHFSWETRFHLKNATEFQPADGKFLQKLGVLPPWRRRKVFIAIERLADVLAGAVFILPFIRKLAHAKGVANALSPQRDTINRKDGRNGSEQQIAVVKMTTLLNPI
jgi:hypothetical protein